MINDTGSVLVSQLGPHSTLKCFLHTLKPRGESSEKTSTLQGLSAPASGLPGPLLCVEAELVHLNAMQLSLMSLISPMLFPAMTFQTVRCERSIITTDNYSCLTPTGKRLPLETWCDRAR